MNSTAVLETLSTPPKRNILGSLGKLVPDSIANPLGKLIEIPPNAFAEKGPTSPQETKLHVLGWAKKIGTDAKSGKAVNQEILEKYRHNFLQHDFQFEKDDPNQAWGEFGCGYYTPDDTHTISISLRENIPDDQILAANDHLFQKKVAFERTRNEVTQANIEMMRKMGFGTMDMYQRDVNTSVNKNPRWIDVEGTQLYPIPVGRIQIRPNKDLNFTEERLFTSSDPNKLDMETWNIFKVVKSEPVEQGGVTTMQSRVEYVMSTNNSFEGPVHPEQGWEVDRRKLTTFEDLLSRSTYAAGRYSERDEEVEEAWEKYARAAYFKIDKKE